MLVRQRIAVVAVLVASGIPSVTRADVSISGKLTQNMSCDAGVCTATAQKAVLNVGDLQTMLANGDVAVKTGSVAKDIDIDQPLTWATISRLTLDAQRSVTVKKPVTATAAGALTLTTNDGGFGGVFITSGKGNVNFRDVASSLVINGNKYVLVGSVARLAKAIAANPSGNFALANSYNAKPDGVYGSTPIAVPFKGRFEGLGNAISHLSVSDASNYGAGLFSQLDFSGLVENLEMNRVKIQGSGDGAGALAGLSSATIQNVVTSGQVTAAFDGGGLVGELTGGTIIASTSSCTVNGDYAAGGLVGESSAIVVSSHASGKVNGGFAGGLVGFDNGFVSNSSASGAVTGGSNANAGGLVGYGYGDSIDKSSATGSVTGGFAVGGAIGYFEGGAITETFATGAVTGGLYTGGFAGVVCSCEGVATIVNAYSTGDVSGGSSSRGGFAGATQQSDGVSIALAYSTGAVSQGGDNGGFIGSDDNSGDLADDYWDLDTSGISDPSKGAGNIPNDPGIAGLFDAQLKSGLPSGFDPKIWGSSPDINSGYPYLLANPPK